MKSACNVYVKSKDNGFLGSSYLFHVFRGVSGTLEIKCFYFSLLIFQFDCEHLEAD